MTRIITLLILLISSTIQAQLTKEQEQVKSTIITFFDGFHKQDSTIIKSVVNKDMILQTIGKNKEGVVKLRSEEFSKFLKSIVSIPKDQKFEEKLLDFNIQIDGDMANAWTSYEFWYNGEFSHCGVNSFQLFNDNGAWKIMYLVDTRRRKGCQEE